MSRLIQRPLAVVAFLLFTLAAAGCAPAPAYSSLGDEEMKKLFPTESEIKGAVGDVTAVSGPKSQAIKTASPPPNSGLSQECSEVAYGDPKSPAAPLTRMFVLNADGQDNARLTWVLSQRASADEMRKAHDGLKSRIGKCEEFYETYDPGTSSGVGYGIKKTANNLTEGAAAVVLNGDTQLAFAVYGVSHKKAEELVRKMAPVMEKRLKASAPKS